MTSTSSNAGAATEKPASTAETRQIVLNDIRAKWGKFSEQDLATLKSKEELVTQIAAKYSLDKVQVGRDVDGLLKGRQF